MLGVLNLEDKIEISNEDNSIEIKILPKIHINPDISLNSDITEREKLIKSLRELEENLICNESELDVSPKISSKKIPRIIVSSSWNSKKHITKKNIFKEDYDRNKSSNEIEMDQKLTRD